MIKHASIIPLIGGETIGAERAFGTLPDYFISYEAFWANDRHIINYYDGQVPYYVLDKNQRAPRKVDVVHSVCPCAGLSQLSTIASSDNQANRWLINTTKYVLDEMQPLVFFGENAPGLAGSIGEGVRDQLRAIGAEHGYTMSVYRTKTLMHGGPQVRERSFYFFWKGNKTPLLGYYHRAHTPIEEVIANAKGNTQQEPINKSTPTADPYYKYILENICGGMSHREFAAQIEPRKARGQDTFSFIEKHNIEYTQLSEWMTAHGYEKEAAACLRKHDKLK